MLSELKEKIRVSVHSDDLVRKFLAWKLPMSLTILALVFGETISIRVLSRFSFLCFTTPTWQGETPDSVLTFIYSVISLPTSQRTKLCQYKDSCCNRWVQGFLMLQQMVRNGIVNTAVKCEISVRVLRWSFCACQEFPDFHYLIIRIYFNFLSYLYYIPVFVL
jgi:hypothetical protein